MTPSCHGAPLARPYTLHRLARRHRQMPPRIPGAGFTLIEVMVVVAIVAILAAIALPNYGDYIKRSKILEAVSALSDLRVRYEQYFLDNRTYVGGCAQFGALVQAQTRSFTIDCSAGEAAATYSGTATGIAANGMSGFTYTRQPGEREVEHHHRDGLDRQCPVLGDAQRRQLRLEGRTDDDDLSDAGGRRAAFSSKR